MAVSAAAREFDLLVVGELNPDLIVLGQDLAPAFGQVEKLVEAATLTVGSSSAILACGAARLGLKTAFIGLVGDDLFGRFMLDSLQSAGVHTGACVVNSSLATGVSIVLSQPGDRAILTYPGTISALRLEDVDLGYLKRSRHLHVSSYFLLEALQHDLPGLFGKAKEWGMTASLDTNWDPSGEWGFDLRGLLAHVDVLLPNENEALLLSGADDLETALDRLGALVETVVVKAGSAGGRLSRSTRSGTTRYNAPALPTEPVDTTGAGDSFNAGYLYGMLSGWAPQDALRLACACGSLSTRAAGGTAAQPTLAAALAALAAVA